MFVAHRRYARPSSIRGFHSLLLNGTAHAPAGPDPFESKEYICYEDQPLYHLPDRFFHVCVWRAGKGWRRCLREMHLPRTLGAPQSAPHVSPAAEANRAGPRRLTPVNPLPEERGVNRLTITLSVPLMLCVAVFLLCRHAGLKYGMPRSA